MSSPDEPLEVTVDVAARPEIVFAHFTDPQRYVQWMGTDATIEPSPGGVYRVQMRDGVEAAGTFQEVDRPHRIVFTWGWVGDPAVSPGSTRVEVTFTPHVDGTTVHLVHHGLPHGEATDQHRQGWELYLDRLGTAVTGGDPGPDPNAAA